jgi:hypothetical protein
MDNKNRLDAHLKEDKSGADLLIYRNGDIIEQISLSFDGLTELIERLGALRSAAATGQNIPDLAGTQIEAVVDTKWYCELTYAAGLPCTSLAFQHPAYGPVAFLIPIEQTVELINLMTRQVLLAATHERAAAETAEEVQ